ncbi:putative gamma-glutamyltransferase YwrD [Smittium mucronatum]|uniref:Putative gamma-glutamyltransferase YwrD n=1 Tax=Smittium mucronatum TaxID=133383 RepID=A0A1R0GTQ1_9FUNG|nr:putative gamma-glutamyltransferase YwrD [Smittium mucronatum]
MYPGSREAKVGGMTFTSRKATVYGTKHAVSSSQQLATQAGMDILSKGGNAADAAVAVEPTATGLGGDCFCLYYDASLKKVFSLNGSGRSASDTSLSDLKALYGDDCPRIPFDSPHAVSVPGAAAGWVDTVNKFGSKKLDLFEILEPAINLAQDGFPVTEIVSHSVPCLNFQFTNYSFQVEKLKAASENHNELLIDGRAPKEGEIFSNPNLAKTLRILAKEGKEGFYKGPVADAIVQTLSKLGSGISHKDLESHQSSIVEPISIDYKGYTVYECPPNGQGIVALQALGIIDSLVRAKKINPLSKYTHNSKEYLHLLIESLRIAFSDAASFIGDPEFSGFDPQSILNREYLELRSLCFSPESRNSNLVHGYPISSSDTVYFSVIDEQGNGCSFICIIPKGLGFTLQNRASNFSLNTGSLNLYEPNKRPYHTIIPSMVTKNNELYAVFGVMGGFMQPQGHVQVLLNLIEFGNTPQKALDLPRICIDPFEETVLLEDGIECIDELSQLGHKVEMVCGDSRSAFGRGQVILRLKHSNKLTGNETIVLAAGCDPRSDGCSSAR